MATDFENATTWHKQGRLNLAEDAYIKALSNDFSNVSILYLLGTLYMQLQKFGLAAQLLLRAVGLKNDHFECWNNLGNCYKSINKDNEARSCWEKALKITGKSDIEYADIWNNLSTLYVNAGKPSAGLEFAEKAILLKPDHVDANWNLALLNLEMGEYSKGFDTYEWGFKTKARLYRNYGEKIPYWDGTPDKTVAVWGEQGLGDEILFASMIPDLQKVSKQVIFECHPRLVKLFKDSFPDVVVYGTRKDEYVNWPEKHPGLDAKIAIGDLGKHFRRELNDFPDKPGYLKASEDRVEHYRKKLAKISPRLKVGISWTGGYVKTRKDYRSILLDQWGPILTQDCDFISLQYTGDAYNTVSETEDKLDVRIHHWPSAVQCPDYSETAALVSALDIVITVNTAIHHLAGALGKPVWTLTPMAKAWRYWSPDKDKKTIPWYPTCENHQQKEIHQWEPIIDRVASNLKSLAEKRRGENEDQPCISGGRNNGLVSVSCATSSEATCQAGA